NLQHNVAVTPLPATWDTFITQLCDFFKPWDDKCRICDCLYYLHQEGNFSTVRAYTTEFRRLQNLLPLPPLTAAQHQENFTCGLDDCIKAEILLHHPATFEEAERIAITLDDLALGTSSCSRRSNNRPSFMEPLRPIAPPPYLALLLLVWNC